MKAYLDFWCLALCTQPLSHIIPFIKTCSYTSNLSTELKNEIQMLEIESEIGTHPRLWLLRLVMPSWMSIVLDEKFVFTLVDFFVSLMLPAECWWWLLKRIHCNKTKNHKMCSTFGIIFSDAPCKMYPVWDAKPIGVWICTRDACLICISAIEDCLACSIVKHVNDLGGTKLYTYVRRVYDVYAYVRRYFPSSKVK